MMKSKPLIAQIEENIHMLSVLPFAEVGTFNHKPAPRYLRIVAIPGTLGSSLCLGSLLCTLDGTLVQVYKHLQGIHAEVWQSLSSGSCTSVTRTCEKVSVCGISDRRRSVHPLIETGISAFTCFQVSGISLFAFGFPVLVHAWDRF